MNTANCKGHFIQVISRVYPVSIFPQTLACVCAKSVTRACTVHAPRASFRYRVKDDGLARARYSPRFFALISLHQQLPLRKLRSAMERTATPSVCIDNSQTLLRDSQQGVQIPGAGENRWKRICSCETCVCITRPRMHLRVPVHMHVSSTSSRVGRFSHAGVIPSPLGLFQRSRFSSLADSISRLNRVDRRYILRVTFSRHCARNCIFIIFSDPPHGAFAFTQLCKLINFARKLNHDSN